MTLPPFNQTTAAGTVPLLYEPSAPTDDADALSVFLTRELKKVATSIRTLVTLSPQAAVKAPTNPVENMMRFAKAPWRPIGGTADAWVTFIGGSWVAL